MKWIGRKPNVHVYGLVLLACIGILFLSANVISDMYPGYRSKIENWIQPLPSPYPASQFPAVFRAPDRFTQHYWVFRNDEQYLVLVSASVTAQDRASDRREMVMIYVEGTNRTGLWAPTLALTSKLLQYEGQIYSGYAGGPQNPSMEHLLEIQAVVVASEGLDPRLAAVQQVTDERIIWSGYIINALCVIAMLGLVWSLAWTPSLRRDRLGRKRLARGQCPTCGYDMAATPNSCPECGWGHEEEGNEDVSGGDEA